MPGGCPGQASKPRVATKQTWPADFASTSRACWWTNVFQSLPRNCFQKLFLEAKHILAHLCLHCFADGVYYNWKGFVHTQARLADGMDSHTNIPSSTAEGLHGTGLKGSEIEFFKGITRFSVTTLDLLRTCYARVWNRFHSTNPLQQEEHITTWYIKKRDTSIWTVVYSKNMFLISTGVYIISEWYIKFITENAYKLRSMQTFRHGSTDEFNK